MERESITDRFYVYQLRVEDVDLPFYLGKGVGDRAKSHTYNCSLKSDSNRHKSNTIKKAYRENKIVLVEILESDQTEIDAFTYEKFYIALYGRRDLGTGCLTNLTDGGEGMSGYKPTVEQREAISKRNRGRKVSLETRLKQSASRKGRRLTKTTLAKMIGRKRSDETKSKIREALIKSHKNESVKEKRRHAALNRPPASETTRTKMREAKVGKSRYVHIESLERRWYAETDNVDEGFYPIAPWMTGRQTESSLDSWKRADEYYTWWKSNDKGYKLMSIYFQEKTTQVHQNMVEKFKNGWIPHEDALWNKLKGNK